jgi:hypothetical protein
MAARVLAARGEPACALLLAHAAVAAAGLTDSPGCQGLAFLDRAHTYQALGDRRPASGARGRDGRPTIVHEQAIPRGRLEHRPAAVGDDRLR